MDGLEVPPRDAYGDTGHGRLRQVAIDLGRIVARYTSVQRDHRVQPHRSNRAGVRWLTEHARRVNSPQNELENNKCDEKVAANGTPGTF